MLVSREEELRWGVSFEHVKAGLPVYSQGKIQVNKQTQILEFWKCPAYNNKYRDLQPKALFILLMTDITTCMDESRKERGHGNQP